MKPKSELILYQTEDNRTRIEVRLENETVWLTQAQMAELFQTTIPNVSMHIRNILAEGELQAGSVVKEFLTTATDGKNYQVQFYNLDVIIAVGYRVKSHRGTQFRQWATQRLREYIIKGFTLDDERLKEGGTRNVYFDELLQRIREIRLSERNFYRKICDIYQTSVDYDPAVEMTQRFFQTVQNKMHWAAHGHTAAEIVRQRADASQPNLGSTNWKNAPGGPLRKADVTIAKNYLKKDELEALNLIVSAYLDFAELQACGRRPMHMRGWIAKLDDFLRLSERNVMTSAGKISHALAEEHAYTEFAQYEEQRRQFESAQPVSDFDQTVAQIKKLGPAKSKRVRAPRRLIPSPRGEGGTR